MQCDVSCVDISSGSCVIGLQSQLHARQKSGNMASSAGMLTILKLRSVTGIVISNGSNWVINSGVSELYASSRDFDARDKEERCKSACACEESEQSRASQHVLR